MACLIHMHAKVFPIQMFQYFREGLHFSAFHCSVNATEPHPIRIQPIRIGSGSDLDSFCHSVGRPLVIDTQLATNL